MSNGSVSRSDPFPSRRSLRQAERLPKRRTLREAATLPSRRSLREAGMLGDPAVDEGPGVEVAAAVDSVSVDSVPIEIVPADTAPIEVPSVEVPPAEVAMIDIEVAETPSVEIPLFESDRTREALTALPPLALSAPASECPDPVPVPKRPLTVRRVLAGACALSCAAGLFVAMAMPGLGTWGGGIGETASALPHQELAGSLANLDSDDPFAAFGAVAAESTGDPVDFVNFRDADIQFPFATGQHLTDGFGPRTYPVAGMHEAQDFAAPEGTPVQAIARGKVLETGWATDGCGFGVLLDHTIDGKSVTSRYCHMQSDSNDLEVGQQVDVGDIVGRVGATGMAFGAHLHFALAIDGEFVDPMPFLLKHNRETRR